VISGLQTRGLVVDFWQIAMRPENRCCLAIWGRCRCLAAGKSGFGDGVRGVVPVAGAGVDAGVAGGPPPTVAAFLGSALKQNDHRADHLRATVTTDEAGRLVVTPFPVQDSAMLRRLALADALILRAPHAPALPVAPRSR